jgi:hypothetical protein
MDSVEYDTPIYLKDNDDNMVILPICDLFNDKSDYLSPDGLRDFEPKEYKVLTKNGWKNINYVYKHETNKQIHKLVTKDRLVSCTSDHSVFQNGEQIKPTELKRGDKIDIIELPKLSLIEFNEEYYVRFYIENLLNNNILNLIDDTFYFNNIQDKVKTAKICYYLHKLNLKYSLDSKAINSDEVWHNINEGEKNQFVYDISTEDGTFVGGIGGVLLKNTDGVNFETPKDISNRKYIGLGNNELVVKGKEYIGVDADTAEFNDIFMRNEMGLDIDYMSPVTINISRKNYIIKLIKKGKEKIKLTGNTIKSKKLAQYVIEFLDEGLKLLLNGDGVGFIELYYKHLTMIYNMDIPLNKIANKSRIKQTIEDYKEHIKKVTKGGSLMARQAHMELLLHNNITPSLGDTVYYINNGTKKSQGDVQKVANEKYSKKEETEYMINNGKPIPKTYRIELNCYLIDEKEMLENPDLKGSYNVTKYIEKFNKTIKPLMVVFHPDIRNEIIVEEPNKRGYFTQNQCDLVNGFPLEEKGQDDLNEILTLSESEINFWRSMNKDPYLMYLEDSINSIDSSWVDSNRELLNKTIENIEKHNDDDEIFSDDWLETPLNAFIIE